MVEFWQVMTKNILSDFFWHTVGDFTGIGKIKFLLFPQGHFSKFKPEDQHNHG